MLGADDIEITFGNTINNDESSGRTSVLNEAQRRHSMKQKKSITNFDENDMAALQGGHGTGSNFGGNNLGPNPKDSNNFYEFFGLIHPLSDIKLCWNIISLLFCLYNMMIVPYRIAFINEPFDVSITAGFILFDVILDIFFCVDVYMRFDRFTFIEEGFVEPNISVIRARYIGHKLFLDLISSLPWDLILIAIVVTNDANFEMEVGIHFGAIVRLKYILVQISTIIKNA